MTEIINPDVELAAAELEDLKERAKLLGVKHHPSAGAEVIRTKIKEFNAAAEAAAATAAAAAMPETAAPVSDGKTMKESEKQKIARIRANAEKLVRVRVTCMNPAKKDWQGEIFTVSNRAVGTLKKFVPFNADDGWHVPSMILDVLKARECQVFVPTKTRNGVTVRKGKLIKEFGIEILDQLTSQEIKELAQRQAMEAGQAV